MVEALVGCIAGAVLVEDTRRMMRDAGLVDIRLTPRSGCVEALAETQGVLHRRIAEKLPPDRKPEDFIASLDIAARKREG